MTRLRAQQGLTLVELLLGLAIAAVLMVPLAAMFQSASASAVITGRALELNADARFALDRIVQRATAAPSVSSGAAVTNAGAAAWLAPLSYTVVNGQLIETGGPNGPVPAPGPPRTSVIATNVKAFALSAPDVGDGQALLKIDLTLQADGNTVSASRTVAVGAPL